MRTGREFKETTYPDDSLEFPTRSHIPYNLNIKYKGMRLLSCGWRRRTRRARSRSSAGGPAQRRAPGLRRAARGRERLRQSRERRRRRRLRRCCRRRLEQDIPNIVISQVYSINKTRKYILDIEHI